MDTPDPRALVAEHLDAVWARAGGVAEPLEVTVGAFRSVLAAPGTPGRAALLAATDRLVRQRAGTGITTVGATAGPPPAPELVAARVAAPDDPAPTVAPPRSRRPLALVLGVLVLLAVGAVVVHQRPSDPVTTAPPPLAAAADTAALSAQEASARLSARSGVPSSGDLLLDQHLARCAAAVAGSARRADYPVPANWTVTSSQVGRTGVATTISGLFFCATSPETTSVSATFSTRAAVVYVQTGPYQVGVLDPVQETVRVSVDGQVRTLTAPATLLGVTPRSVVLAAARATGALAPVTVQPTAITDTDQPAAARDLSAPANRHLGECLSGQTGALVPDPDAWRTVISARGALLARAPGMVGLCVDAPGPDGLPAVMTVVPVPDPAAAGQLAVVAQLGAVGGGTSAYLLLSVDPRATDLQAFQGEDPLTCTVANGVGLCTTAASATEPTRITALGLGGAVVAGPVQQ